VLSVQNNHYSKINDNTILDLLQRKPTTTLINKTARVVGKGCPIDVEVLGVGLYDLLNFVLVAGASSC